MQRQYLICVLLALVTFSAYWPVRTYDFIYYDDPQFITENEVVKAGLTAAGIRYALTSPVVGNWHPVTTLSHMMDCALLGVNAGAHHLINAFIHGLNAALLFCVLSQLTRATWRSVMVAALFALHPLRVESVAWISERKDVLCWFFGLLSLLAYARYTRCVLSVVSSSTLNAFKSQAYWLTIVFFALALMSKAMLVTFPFLLLLLDIWPLNRFTKATYKRLITEKLPFFILSAVFCFITLQVQKNAGAMSVIRTVSSMDRVSNAVMSYTKYLGKTFWPSDLAVVYPHPSAPYAASGMWAGWQIGLAVLMLLGISIFCIYQFKRRPYLTVGWFWYLGTLVPVIGIIQVGEQAMADRYTYIPLVGPCIGLVWYIVDLTSHWRLQRHFLAVLVVFIIGFLLMATHHQLRYWKNTVTLFAHNIEVTPANPSAHFALAVGLENNGETTNALNHYTRAITLDPHYQKAHYNMGQIYRKQGRWVDAAAAYRFGLKVRPTDLASRLNLASVLNKSGLVKEAVSEFEEALRLDPDSLEGLNNLAWVLATSIHDDIRNGAAAVQYAERACRIAGTNTPFFAGTLAASYAEAGRFDEAVATAERAINLAEATGQTELATRNSELLQLYRAQKPHRESP